MHVDGGTPVSEIPVRIAEKKNISLFLRDIGGLARGIVRAHTDTRSHGQ